MKKKEYGGPLHHTGREQLTLVSTPHGPIQNSWTVTVPLKMIIYLMFLHHLGGLKTKTEKSQARFFRLTFLNFLLQIILRKNGDILSSYIIRQN
jgi:hypothetical protein